MRMKLLNALPMAAAILMALFPATSALAKSGGANSDGNSGISKPAAASKSLGTAWLSAVVSANGKLMRGAGVVDVSVADHISYTITFARDVSECAYTVVSRSNDNVPSLELDASSGAELTLLSAGGFSLIVYCWK